jgi:hypothetical protein
MLTDLRCALRLLRKSPWFTALTVLVLASGLAISLYTYAALNMMIYRDLPFPDGGSVVRVGYGAWPNFEPRRIRAGRAASASPDYRRARRLPRFACARRRARSKPQHPVLRTHEIGLRRALGATNRSVIGLFVKQSARQLTIGLSVSALLSVAVLVVIRQTFAIGAGELADRRGRRVGCRSDRAAFGLPRGAKGHPARSELGVAARMILSRESRTLDDA